MPDLKQHPLSAAFPAMPETDLAALAADIKTNGLRQTIYLYQGQVLDGWHRYLACKKSGTNVRTSDYVGKDPVGFVKSYNWHRRQLSASQKAVVEVALREWNPVGSNQHNTAEKEGRHRVPTLPVSNSEMAKTAGVSERTIRQAKIVHVEGDDKLKKDVKDGRVSAKAAVTQIRGEPKPKASAKSDATAKLEARIEKLEADLAQAREAQEAAAEEAERLIHLEAGTEADFIKSLQLELKATRAKRDDLMRENGEMRRQIKFLEKKLKV